MLKHLAHTTYGLSCFFRTKNKLNRKDIYLLLLYSPFEQKQDQQVTISIEILTWNLERKIGTYLASLSQGLSGYPSEAIVIDNGSQGQTCAVVLK